MAGTEQEARNRLSQYPEILGDRTVRIFKALLEHSLTPEGKDNIIRWILNSDVTIHDMDVESNLISKDTTVWGCDDNTLRARAQWWDKYLLRACIDLHPI